MPELVADFAQPLLFGCGSAVDGGGGILGRCVERGESFSSLLHTACRDFRDSTLHRIDRACFQIKGCCVQFLDPRIGVSDPVSQSLLNRVANVRHLGHLVRQFFIPRSQLRIKPAIGRFMNGGFDAVDLSLNLGNRFLKVP